MKDQIDAAESTRTNCIDVADKGFIDQVRQALLEERHGITLVAPPRKRMQGMFAPVVLKQCARWRKHVEWSGANPRARPVALSASTDSQDSGAYDGRLSQPSVGAEAA